MTILLSLDLSPFYNVSGQSSGRVVPKKVGIGSDDSKSIISFADEFSKQKVNSRSKDDSGYIYYSRFTRLSEGLLMSFSDGLEFLDKKHGRELVEVQTNNKKTKKKMNYTKGNYDFQHYLLKQCKNDLKKMIDLIQYTHRLLRDIKPDDVSVLLSKTKSVIPTKSLNSVAELWESEL